MRGKERDKEETRERDTARKWELGRGKIFSGRGKFNFQWTDIQIPISKFKSWRREREEEGKKKEGNEKTKKRRRRKKEEEMDDETEMQSSRVILCRWN